MALFENYLVTKTSCYTSDMYSGFAIVDLTTNECIYKCEIGAYESDFPLVIRNYMEGDTIKLKVGTKKVSRIFIDKKVPSHIRKMYPVVLNKNNEVIFVPKFYKDLERKTLQSGLFMIQLIY